MLRGLLASTLLLVAGCAYESPAAEVALGYARALYATDLGRAYALISAEDRRVKDEETFRREGGAPSGFALEVARHLASFIEARPLATTVRGERATVTMKFRLPNANAPEVRALVADWDEQRLNALRGSERERITAALDDLHRSRRLPMLDGEETFELVREAAGWRVFLHWAGGVRVRFLAARRDAGPLEVAVTPEETRVQPGERLHVTVRATNRSTREIVARVVHRIEPRAQADSLALLQCPLLIPVTLGPGQTEEFRSEYLLLTQPPREPRDFQVTYEFVPVIHDER